MFSLIRNGVKLFGITSMSGDSYCRYPIAACAGVPPISAAATKTGSPSSATPNDPVLALQSSDQVLSHFPRASK
jgi:hypothetical protein